MTTKHTSTHTNLATSAPRIDSHVTRRYKLTTAVGEERQAAPSDDEIRATLQLDSPTDVPEERRLDLQTLVVPVSHKVSNKAPSESKASSCVEKQERTLLKFNKGINPTPSTHEGAPIGRHSLRKLTQRLITQKTPSPLLESSGALRGCLCDTVIVRRKERMINPDSWHLQLTEIGVGKESFQRHQKTYLLAIKLDTIEFFSHFLMMDEEVLARDLLKSYHSYQASEVREKYSASVERLHQTELKLLNSRNRLFSVLDSNEDVADAFQETVELEEQVYYIRQEQERLSRHLIDVLQGLVDKYSLIEEARKQQGHNLTRVKMNVVSVEPKQKQNKYRRIERRMIVAEYENIKGFPASPSPLHDHFDLEGYTKYRRVEATCAAHLLKRSQLVEELERLKQADESSPDRMEELESDLRELGSFPQRLSLTEAAKQEAQKHYKAVTEQKKQSQDLLFKDICITYDEEGTVAVPDVKQQQQFEDSKLQVCVRINDQLVGKTEIRSLNSDYRISFREEFKVFLHDRPEIVALQLIHTTARQVTDVWKVNLDMPSSLEPIIRSYEFETDLTINCATYQSTGGPMVAPVSGAVKVLTCWEPPKKSHSQTPLMISNPLAEYDANLRDRIVPPLRKDNDTETEAKRTLNEDKEQVEVYVEDRDSILFEPMDWSMQKRIQFLKQRWKITRLTKEGWIHDGGPETSPTTPSITSLISHKDLERNIEAMKSLLDAGSNAEIQTDSKVWVERRESIIRLIRGSPLLKAIEEREEHLKQLYVMMQKVYQRIRANEAKRLSKHEVVRETMTFGFQLDMKFLKNILTPPKKLRPRPKQVTVIRSFPKATRVVVSIRSASNLPQRNTKDNKKKDFAIDSHSSTGSLIGDEELLTPFVEISVNEKTTRTPPVSGPDPLFNQKLALPFLPKTGALSPSTMEHSRDVLQIRVFDEVHVNQGSPSRRKEIKFLGHLEVSLSTVYHLGRVEGLFRINLPVLLLNYQKNTQPALLSLFITFDPPLPPPHKLHSHISSLSSYKSRSRSLLDKDSGIGYTMTLSGDPVPYSQFVSTVSLLESLETVRMSSSLDASMRAMAEFVRCIPSLDDTKGLFPNSEIWQTTSEFIGNAAGHEIDHANLLVGLFSTLEIEVYVVLGTSLDSSSSAFVFTRTGQKDQFWNPMNAHCFHLKDTANELRSVKVVYNDRGVWANLQKCSEPWALNWDFRCSRFWKHVDVEDASKTQQNALQQPCSYVELDTQFYAHLEARVEEIARSVLCKHRRMMVTPPHKLAKRVLKKLLKDLPSDFNIASGDSNLAIDDPVKTLEDKHRDLLERELGKMTKIDGMVFSLTYSDQLESKIEEFIVGTKLHQVERPDLKFVIASWIEPMGSAFIFRIWLYLATIYNHSL